MRTRHLELVFEYLHLFLERSHLTLLAKPVSVVDATREDGLEEGWFLWVFRGLFKLLVVLSRLCPLSEWDFTTLIGLLLCRGLDILVFLGDDIIMIGIIGVRIAPETFIISYYKRGKNQERKENFLISNVM